MLQLAFNNSPQSYGRMRLTVNAATAERELTGKALKEIREAKRPKVSQGHVGKALGMTGANYQQYEAGVRKELDDAFVDKVLAILGSDREELAFQRTKLLGGADRDFRGSPRRPGDFEIEVFGRSRAGSMGMEVYDVGEPLRRIDFRQLFGPHTEAVEMAGETMIPWAEPGEVVIFDRDRYPRRGQGCVIETKQGQFLIKLYERVDGSTLFLRELRPEERVIPLALTEVKGIYAVRLRGD